MQIKRVRDEGKKEGCAEAQEVQMIDNTQSGKTKPRDDRKMAYKQVPRKRIRAETRQANFGPE